MTNSDKFNDFFIQWIIFFIAFYIVLLMDWTIIQGIIILVGGSIIFYVIKKIIESILDKKRKHKKELIEEILKPLTLLGIRYDYKDFREWIDGLEILEKKGDLFVWAFKHLASSKKYKVILSYFTKAKEFIEDLNDKLSKLKLYLDDNIKSSDREIIPHISKEIIRYVFIQDTDVDCIKIKEVRDKNIYVYRNNKDTFRIPCILGVEKTTKLVSELIEKKEFLNQLEQIQEIDRNAKKELNEFTGQLKTFLDDIKHNFKLKGRCEECSRWYKYFDC